MTELELKYGCNPNQKPARIFMESGELPIRVLNGRPGYINFMDAFNSWQLVRELKAATGLPAARFQLAHQLPAVQRVQKIDVTRPAAQHRHRQFARFHKDARRLLVGIAAVFQREFASSVPRPPFRAC